MTLTKTHKMIAILAVVGIAGYIYWNSKKKATATAKFVKNDKASAGSFSK